MSTIETNKAIVTRFNKLFIEGGQSSVFDETVSPDFVNRTPHEGRSAGPDGARFFFTQVLRPAFPDLTVTIDDQVGEGDRVVTRKTYQATHQGPFMGLPATGRRISFGVIDIIRLRDGQYVEHWAVADMAGLMRQLNG